LVASSGRITTGWRSPKGRYIAYLGHDDLWHPDHLAQLVRAIEAHEADFVFALTEDIGPPEMPTRSLLGLCASGSYEWSIWAPPSSWLHRTDLIERIGLWRDYRSIILPPDVDFLDRAYDHRCRIVPVNELTVFKFTSALRTNSYVARRNDEQVRWWERLVHDPELRYRELVEVLLSLVRQHPDIAYHFNLPSRLRPVPMVVAYRARRGSQRNPTLRSMDSANPPLLLIAQRFVSNAEHDIGPAADLDYLHSASDMPDDGLFVGLNWYSLEKDVDGTLWRWIDGDAQIVVTRPSGLRRRIELGLDAWAGDRALPCRLQARDASGVIVAEVALKWGGSLQSNYPSSQGSAQYSCLARKTVVARSAATREF
jgi:glycosyltransferase involved in cell wall biosynthesis